MRHVDNLIKEERIITNQQFIDKLLPLKGSRIYVQNMVKTNPQCKDICVATYHFTLNDVFEVGEYIFIKAEEDKTDLRFGKEVITVQEDTKNSEFSVTFVDENSFQIVNLFYDCDRYLDSK